MDLVPENREASAEVQQLISELGMSEKEAYEVLGLTHPSDLSQQTNDTVEPETQEQAQERTLMAMFPNISLPHIREVLKQTDQDAERASELLLSHDLLHKEYTGSSNDGVIKRKATKQYREVRKSQKKERRLLKNEEADIQAIISALGVTEEEARELYWTHGNDMTTAIMVKMPSIPLTTRLEAERRMRELGASNIPLKSFSRSPSPLGVTDYTHLSSFELQEQIDANTARINALQASQRAYRKDLLTTRIRDTSSEIHDLKDELRLLKLAQMAQLKVRTNRRVIDLHGYTLDEAKAISEEAIRNFMQGGESEIEIVSGAGRHSINGKAVIKEWLRIYLRSQNIKVTERDGSFVVRHRMIL